MLNKNNCMLIRRGPTPEEATGSKATEGIKRVHEDMKVEGGCEGR
jgi:hypothetical protein